MPVTVPVPLFSLLRVATCNSIKTTKANEGASRCTKSHQLRRQEDHVVTWLVQYQTFDLATVRHLLRLPLRAVSRVSGRGPQFGRCGDDRLSRKTSNFRQKMARFSFKISCWVCVPRCAVLATLTRTCHQTKSPAIYFLLLLTPHGHMVVVLMSSCFSASSPPLDPSPL